MASRKMKILAISIVAAALGIWHLCPSSPPQQTGQINNLSYFSPAELQKISRLIDKSHPRIAAKDLDKRSFGEPTTLMYLLGGAFILLLKRQKVKQVVCHKSANSLPASSPDLHDLKGKRQQFNNSNWKKSLAEKANSLRNKAAL